VHNTDELLKQLDGLTFLRELYPECADPDQQSEIRVSCPFHDDGASPSGTFSVDKKLFRCFSCNAHGDAFSLFAQVTKCTRNMAIEYVARQLGVPSKTAVPPKQVEEYHQALRLNGALLAELLQRRGLDATSVDRWRLGWDTKKQRLTIPIRDESGAVVNVRQYDLLKVHDEKMKFINTKGRGEMRLYPYEALQQTHVVLTEGELKMMANMQRGFNSMTTTGGASGWKDAWDRLFTGKVVYLCYDIDATGRARAQNIARRLVKHAAAVHIIHLPLDPVRHPKGDLCDYYVKERYTAQDFYNLMLGTPAWSPTAEPTGLKDDMEYEVELGQASKAQYYLHKVSTEVIVSAKDTAPYIAPHETRVNCGRDLEICAGCPVFQQPEEALYEVSADDPDLLRLIEVSSRNQEKELKDLIGIPAKCASSSLAVISSHNLEEVRLVPQLNTSQHAPTGGEQIVVKAYHVGHGIETNGTYGVKGRVAVTPKTQHATMLLYNSEANVDNLSSFDPSETELKELEVFRPENGSFAALAAKIDEIYLDFTHNVHRIKQRPEMQLLMDLVWHSALYVTLEDEPQKGWVEALVLGDSGQGKSEMMKRLMTHYGLGEKIDMKGASVAGLKGGLQQTGDRWFVTWGSYVLNDRRMVCLEETEGASEQVLQALTDMRSSGLAELTKIERRRAWARTRALWLSNPRSARSIETYNFGVEAIKELMGSLQDVRRFDAAMVVASNEVPKEIINAPVKGRVEHRHTAELSRRLILWAWSRRPNQVIITEGARQACYDRALDMARRYSSQIPLVEPADQRLKLARLATALAARTFSSDPEGKKIVVETVHVNFIAGFLDELYTNRYMAYNTYSEVRIADAELLYPETITEALKALPYPVETVRGLLRAPSIRWEDVAGFGGCDRDQAQNLVGLLQRNNALRRSRDGMFKTGAFIEYLKNVSFNGHGDPAAQRAVVKEKGY